MLSKCTLDAPSFFLPLIHVAVKVYIDNLAAQSGASLFLQEHSEPYSPLSGGSGLNWTYDKTENRTDFADFTFVLAEPQRGSDLVNTDKLTAGMKQPWRVMEVIRAFNGFPVRRLLSRLKKTTGSQKKGGAEEWQIVEMRDALWILQNGP